MRKALLVLLIVIVALGMIGANKTVRVHVINHSDGEANVALYSTELDSEGNLQLVHWFTIAEGKTKVFEVAKGAYLVEGYYCGEVAAPVEVDIVHFYKLKIAACNYHGEVEASVGDGTLKFLSE